MLSTQQPADYGYGSGGFAAHPKVVNQKNKFKDPYGRADLEQYYPQNIMIDKRVVRGSTHAAMVIPAGTYPDTLFGGASGQKGKSIKSSNKQKSQAAEEYFSRDIKTPDPLPYRQNIDIQTDQFVEELTDKAPNYELGCQTDFVIERPPTPRSIPIKRGKDAKTCVEDNELFKFDHDVEPILSVLCGKTLESARMEVLEEEELRVMKEQQHHFEDVKNAEMQESQRMEQSELRKKQEFERRKQNERDKKKNKIAGHRKIVSRAISKQYIEGMKDNVYRHLTDVGVFTNQFQIEVLEQDVMPWLAMNVERFVKQLDDLNLVPDDFAKFHIDSFQKEHMHTVEEERKRQENVRLALEEKERQRIAEKLRRRASREAKRKAEELRKLKEEINAAFISKGEFKEHILSQELLEIDGNYYGQNIAAGLGGTLGQMIICFSGIQKFYKQIFDVLDPKHVQGFLFFYIDTKMRTEKLIFQVGKEVENFLNSLEKPLQLNEMRVMKDANYLKFREILSNTDLYGDKVLAYMKTYAKNIDLSVKAYDAVYEGLWDLYCKKPLTAELNAKKLEGFVQRIKLTVPPQDVVEEDGSVKPSVTNLDLKAIVRIRIPLKRPVIEKQEEGQEEGNYIYNVRIDGEEPKKVEEVKQPEPPAAEIDPELLGEQEIEDKVFCINPVGEQNKIWVFHQAASRYLRKDLIHQMKKYIKDLETIEADEILEKVEAYAVEVEKKFISLFTSQQAIIQPPVPVFDFEIN